MGEAKNPFRLDNTSILIICKVFKHLLTQWMAIWMHPYFIKAMEDGGGLILLNLGNNWVQTIPP